YQINFSFFDEASEYRKYFIDNFLTSKINNQANTDRTLSLLHKVNTHKNLGRLDPFIKRNVLRYDNTSQENANKIYEAFNYLQDVERLIARTSQKIQILQPLAENYDIYNNAKSEHYHYSELKNGLEIFYTEKKEEILRKQESETIKEIEKNEKEQIQYEQRQKTLQNEIDTLNSQLANLGIDKLKIEQNALEDLKLKRVMRKSKYDDVKVVLETIGITEKYPEISIDNFDDLVKEIHEIRNNYLKENDEFNIRINSLNETKKIEQHKGDKFEEIISYLTQNPFSNIPHELIQIRFDILKILGVSFTDPEKEILEDYPFVGELINVNLPEGQDSLEQMIETALRPFALTMLVKNSNIIQKMNEYIAVNNLNFTFKYMNLETEYGLFKEGRSSISQIVLNENKNFDINNLNILNLLQFKNSDDFFCKWIHRQIADRYNYRIIYDRDSINTPKINYVIFGDNYLKRNNFFIKDDSVDLTRLENRVLGFENTKKADYYKTELIKTERIIQDCNDQITKLKNNIINNKNKYNVSIQKFNIEYFSDIDYLSIDKEIVEKQEIIKLLEQTLKDNNFDELENRLNSLIDERNDISGKIKRNAFTLGELKSNLKNIQGALEKVLNKLSQETVLYPTQTILEELIKSFGRVDTIDELEIRRNSLSKNYNSLLQNLIKTINSSGEFINNSLNNYRIFFEADLDNIFPSIENIDYFYNEYLKLTKDILIRYKKEFTNYWTKTTQLQVSQLLHSLSEAERNLKKEIDSLNKKLFTVNFNDTPNLGTYLFLEPEPINDVDVNSTLSDLKQTTNDLDINITDEEKYKSIIHKFKLISNHIERLINQDNSDTPNKIPSRLLDVRERFRFVPHEIIRTANEERLVSASVAKERDLLKETYNSNPLKSGGEQQKLASFCFLAALSYLLCGDISKGVPSYAPIAIDEAFHASDKNFTILSLKAFLKFNFQPIIFMPTQNISYLENNALLKNVHYINKNFLTNISNIISMSVLRDDNSQRISLGPAPLSSEFEDFN
ncbi:MAG: hypothetical protein LBD41_06130, partial [Clostridiales Family XIII bacterium]|nr:hypothetical protein [Clostridiales Family XIII bacterium]